MPTKSPASTVAADSGYALSRGAAGGSLYPGKTDTGRITELRLTAFKSYRDVVLPLTPMTVLIGRNGSGKSDALDGLEVLSRLAKGSEIRDALDGA